MSVYTVEGMNKHVDNSVGGWGTGGELGRQMDELIQVWLPR